MKTLKFLLILVVVRICRGQGDIAQNLARLIQYAAYPDEPYIPLKTKVHEGVKDDTAQQKATGDPPKVNTTSGEAEGISNDMSHAFFQIPYAEPPTDHLRWQPPVPVQNPKPIDATTNEGLQCYQFETDCVPIANVPACRRINMAEDCLVLNVFVPLHVNLSHSTYPPSDRLPVLFYIHGGFFYAGAGTRLQLDGQELANVTNTVVVTINYRLGPLGFLYHVEEGKGDIIGNQGLKDQQLAMQWVQDNIDKFGGDKTRVTVFGNSAGAQSTMFHALSKVSKPLYSGTIQQSNPAVFKYPTPDQAQKITGYLTTSLGCNATESERDCLMNAEARTIINRLVPVSGLALANGDVDTLIEPYRPMIDGDEFSDQPLALFKQGKWNSEKPAMIGVTTQELEDIQFFLPQNLTVGKSLFTVVNYIIFGPQITDIVVKKYESEYPPGPGEDWGVTFGIEMTHLFFECPSRAMARYASQTATGGNAVYFFADDHPVLDRTCQDRNDGSDVGCYYTTHADEIEFVFRTVTDPNEDDELVEDQFSTYWGSFARTGNPSNNLEVPVGSFPDWPQYTSETTNEASEFLGNNARLFAAAERYRNLAPMLMAYEKDKRINEEWQNIRMKAPTSVVETGYEEEICDFWDSIGYYMDPIPLPTTTTEAQPQPTLPQNEETTSDARFFTYSLFTTFVFTVVSFLFNLGC